MVMFFYYYNILEGCCDVWESQKISNYHRQCIRVYEKTMVFYAFRQPWSFSY